MDNAEKSVSEVTNVLPNYNGNKNHQTDNTCQPSQDLNDLHSNDNNSDTSIKHSEEEDTENATTP